VDPACRCLMPVSLPTHKLTAQRIALSGQWMSICTATRHLDGEDTIYLAFFYTLHSSGACSGESVQKGLVRGNVGLVSVGQSISWWSNVSRSLKFLWRLRLTWIIPSEFNCC
jgi:hypothetical protein